MKRVKRVTWWLLIPLGALVVQEVRRAPEVRGEVEREVRGLEVEGGPSYRVWESGGRRYEVIFGG